MRSLYFALTVALLFGPGGLARAENTANTNKLGKVIDGITLADSAGQPWSLQQLKDKKAIVVVFLSFECPVSTSYSQELATLAKNYEKQNVAFVGICAAEELSAAQVAKQAKDFGIPFAVLHDPKLAAVDAFKAEM